MPRRARPLTLLCLLLLLVLAAPACAWSSGKQSAGTPTKVSGDEEVDADAAEPPRQLSADPRSVVAAPFGDRLNLTTPWLFHSGSGLNFAAPGLDDSSWTPLETQAPLFKSLIFNANEVWYRVHVHLVRGTHDLGLTVADFGGSYRVYVNGTEIGGHGLMADRGDYLLARSATYQIPDGALAPDTVIAIHAFIGRIDRATLMLDDGLTRRSAVYLGPANVLYRDQQTYFANGLTENIATLTLWAVLLALSVGLAFLIKRTPVYPLLAVFAGGHLLAVLLTDWASFHYYPRTHWLVLLTVVLRLISDVALLAFMSLLAAVRRRRTLVIFTVFYVLATASLALAATGVISFAVYAGMLRTAQGIFRVVLIVLIYIGKRRKQQDASVLAWVLAGYAVYRVVWWLLGNVVFFYAPLNTLSRAFTANIVPDATADLAIVVAFVGVVLVRTLRIVRERAAIANEIEAARTMQQLLLGQANQATPGFQVESVYLPAGEVGGDFFLVSPCTDDGDAGSLTVIVGDVSGKGMRAAMQVSMILGVLRREPSREPAAMLHGLNQALAAEGETGFTTACCVRLAPDGRYTVANAGHIAPYVDGAELPTEPALPLGLAALEPGETYPLLAGRLLPGQRLVLLSDGVAEARTRKGELFGFERLGPLTLRSAGEIAATAQQFGQEDDITVVTIGAVATTTAPPPPPPIPAVLVSR